MEWDGEGSHVVPVCIGTPHGSILSLKLCNISIYDLLLELQHCSYGLKSNGRKPNYFADAYYITLLAKYLPQIQCLIHYTCI